MSFQILSLDGGGIRGVYTAAYLAAVEEDHQVRITDHFDLVVGTSTGGILALALGAGLRPAEILDFYVRHGPSIFAGSIIGRKNRHWIRNKYGSEPLRNALQETFGGKTLGNSSKRLVITSYNIGENDVYLFRTPHLDTLRRDYKVPMWKIGLATSAAPTYFPTCHEVDGLRLIDGGVWANNPSLVGLVEAVGAIRIPQHEVSLLSVGTVSGLKTFPKKLDWAGKIGWARSVPDLMLDAAATAVTNQVRFLISPRFMRVNVTAPAAEVSLDDLQSVQQLIAKARHSSRKDMPEVANRFLGHAALPYDPLHTTSD